MQSCGTYCPKKVCNCSTPSTTDNITPPVRSRRTMAAPALRFCRKDGRATPPGPASRCVGDHRAVVINNPTQDHRNGDPGCRDRNGEETGAVEHA